MKFISVRDLRSQSAQIWRDLPDEHEMVVTSNGRPVALLTSVEGSNVETSLAAWRQVRATQAVSAIQQHSLQQGTDTITMDEIDNEISIARSNR
ncbi:MAG: type II toxin-antitoxin system Phd/YefM family antitoxin [Mariprofundales bacterium]|nr:type II toxin-antitoxin system Phd/YefM family antitoxin [Mariprofundales bacterium]